MKTEKDKEIDDLFKQGLEPSDAHSGYMEEDWSAVEHLLDERKKRPVIIYWLPILGSVAALLMLVIGWWLLKPVVTHTKKPQQMAATKIQAKPGRLGDKQQQIANNTASTDTVTPGAIKPRKSIAGTSNSDFASNKTAASHTGFNNLTNNPVVIKGNVAALQPVNAGQIQQPAFSPNKANLSAYGAGIVIYDATIASDQNIKPGNYVANNSAVSQSSGAIKKKIINSYRPHFALTVLAGSDKNSVSSFQQAKPGNDVGLLFSVGISKRFTISTGALYASKQYMSNFANYHTNYKFQTDPSSIVANCKMFDIPLNIDYKVFNTYRNKISIGTGISSYLMLHESYQYNYPEYATGPAKYNVPNPDKYLLSIVNLQATYERRINSSVGITLQPYMKLPLSAVGASQVRLQSTGLAVGLTWNLNSLSKP